MCLPLLHTMFPPLNCFCNLSESAGSDWCQSVTGFSILSTDLCAYSSTITRVLLKTTIQYVLISGRVMLPFLFFFVKTGLALLGLVPFHMNVTISLFMSTETLLGFLWGFHQRYRSVCGELAVLLCCVIQSVNTVCLHLVRFSLISFSAIGIVSIQTLDMFCPECT